MKNVLYWKECLSDLECMLPYQATIQALLNGEYANLHLEQLNVKSIHPIYSIRHSDSTRILFTSFQNKICFLEVILNHDYHKSRFLRNRHSLQHHLEKISEFISTTEITKPDLPIYTAEHTNYQPVSFHQDFIELNSHQQHAIHAAFPMVLHGPAGSGKTTVAIELLQKLYQNQIPSIIYITESSKLRDYVRSIWDNLYLDTVTDTVQFLTYQEFLIDVLNVPAEQIVNKQHFESWYKSHRHHVENYPLEMLYKEFRLLSGYNFEQYQELGFSQSHDKKQIWDLFSNYQCHLGTSIASELNFIESVPNEAYLIVDEAQDFSFGQLKTLLNYARSNCAILLGDHQILFDNVSKFPFIKQYYFKQYKTIIRNYPLTGNHRCSQKVSELVNLVTFHKYLLSGGCLDKIEVDYLASNLDDLGSTEWLHKPSDGVKEQSFQPSWAIINFSKEPHTSFTHPFVFTPAESKGLEFETVILWKPFENNQNILGALRRYKPSTNDPVNTTHLPKQGRENLAYLSDFNILITTMTRAKTRLIIIDNVNIKNHEFLSNLKRSCTEIDIIEETTHVDSFDTWFQKAQKLMVQGFEAQAKRVFIEKLRHDENEFELFKCNLQPSMAKSNPITVAQEPSSHSVSKALTSPSIDEKSQEHEDNLIQADKHPNPTKEATVKYCHNIATLYQEKDYRENIEKILFNNSRIC